MKVNGLNIPENLYYTKDHEWALQEKQDVIRIGITDYAQKTLHEIVFVGLPKEGTKIEQMRLLGTVESVKAVSEVYSPVSGQVLEINKELELSPELVNQDPYGKGWIALIKVSDIKKDQEKLLSPYQYAEHIEKILQR